ncbi:MAG: signal peptidase I [Clostridiales bacterium]|jgi:signal peptidase I|nr:signal peptidase I [Clostridiales bacterium]
MDKWVKILKEIRSWIIILALALVLSALINSQLFAMATVKEVSMQNTLYADQMLVINRLSYRNKTPKTGDIIVFYQNREIGSFIQEFIRSLKNIIPFAKSDEEIRDRLVKRVIGTPGDHIDILDGDVYLNGELLDEPYVKGITEEDGYELPLTVGENQLFVMGDNREHSMDSRAFGLIETSHVEGKATFRIYPFNKLGKLN